MKKYILKNAKYLWKSNYGNVVGTIEIQTQKYINLKRWSMSSQHC